MIRKGTMGDVDLCQRLTRKHSKWFPFVMKSSLREAVLRGELHVAEQDGVFVGFVSFRCCRDGWQTVYELAVDDEYAKSGAGRNLLYSVPTPIRLKCPVDNHRANRFYADAGMKMVELLPAKRPLCLWHMRVLCVHVQGGNKKVPQWARETGLAYGTRHDHKPAAYPFMVDINWKNYDWGNYIEKIQKWRPVMAMVADYESVEQKKLMLSQVESLRRLGVLRIMVCPKFDGAIKDIPNDCMLAVSVPSKYAGFLPDPTEVGNRRVHLLGGSPKKIRKAMNMYSAICSIDYNAHERAAQFSRVYLQEGSVQPLDGTHFGYEKCLIASAVNIREMINAQLTHPHK